MIPDPIFQRMIAHWFAVFHFGVSQGRQILDDASIIPASLLVQLAREQDAHWQTLAAKHGAQLVDTVRDCTPRVGDHSDWLVATCLDRTKGLQDVDTHNALHVVSSRINPDFIYRILERVDPLRAGDVVRIVEHKLVKHDPFRLVNLMNKDPCAPTITRIDGKNRLALGPPTRVVIHEPWRARTSVKLLEHRAF